MDIFEYISRNLIIPFYNRRHGINNTKFYDALLTSQFDSAEKIKSDQWIKLKELLNFSYNSNLFYKEHFDKAGVQPDDIKNWDDFTKIPLLTKDHLRNNLDIMISQGFTKENLTHKRTGGSTGVPVHLYMDQNSVSFKHAAAQRHNKWANYLPGMKRAALWGDTDKKYSLKETIYMKLYDRTIFLDTLMMDDPYLLDFVKQLRKFKPKSLVGHAHSLFFLAQFFKDKNINDIKFNGIITTAETLSHAERKVIEEVFGNIVFDRYGCEELSLIASECEAHEGLHINSEGLYVEVIGGSDTEPGELVITDLTNKGMPFIRYEIGDMATMLEKPCSCGRGLPRLGKVMGRTSDFLYTPEGKMISGISILDTFVIHIKGFKQVQIIQNEIGKIILKIIKDENFGEHSLQALKETVPKIFGPKMKYQIEFVDKITMTARGKFQFTICNIENKRI